MADDLTGLQVVEKITEANNKFKEDVIKKATSEVDKLTTELKKFEEEVKTVQKDAEVKGATILDMQGEVKNLDAKLSRLRGNADGAKKTIIDLLAQKFTDMKDTFTKMGASASANIMGETFRFETKVGSITTSSQGSGNAASYIDYLPWQPGMEPTGQTRIREFVRTIQSDFDTVYYPQAAKPVGTGSFNSQTTEGNLKSQVDRSWTMNTLTLYPFAGWAAVSRQSLRNILFLQTWLPVSLNEQLLDQEDLMFANALVAAATGSNTTTGITVPAERIVFLIKNLIATKFHPNLCAIEPGEWAKILVTKPSNYSLPNVVSIDPGGQVRILNTPIRPVNWLAAGGGGGRVLIGDFTKAAIVESEGLTFRQSENGTSQDFMKNVVTFLLERTEGLAIFRPDAFITDILV